MASPKVRVEGAVKTNEYEGMIWFLSSLILRLDCLFLEVLCWMTGADTRTKPAFTLHVAHRIAENRTENINVKAQADHVC